ncbi:MAG: hypothetical protein ACLR06_13340 [Christensenellaceae bacterium]
MSMKNGSVYCLASNNLHVYDKDTPFEAESWLLFSVIDEDVLFEDIRSITQTILGFLALAFVIGVAVVFLVCYLFSRPITALTDRVKTAAVAPTMRFGSTSIKEIDELTGAIEQLSSRVFEANSKFEKTIELTDMPVASFEYDVNEDYLFLTENFPEVIGLTPEKPFKEFSLRISRRLSAGFGHISFNRKIPRRKNSPLSSIGLRTAAGRPAGSKCGESSSTTENARSASSTTSPLLTVKRKPSSSSATSTPSAASTIAGPFRKSSPNCSKTADSASARL